MSFRDRDNSGLGSMGKMEPGDRKFGGGDDKGDSDDRPSRFDHGRGRRPPFGRGRRPSPPGRDKPFGDRPRDFGGYGRNDDFPTPGGRDMMRDRSPVHGPEDRYSDRFKKNDRRDEGGVRKEGGRPPYYDEPPRDRYGGMDGRYPPSRFDPPPAGDFKHRPTGYSAPPPKDYSDGFPKPNECEIIAMNRHQRLYAESVEARIKALGILVDVLFLKDEALLTQTIDDIARKGSLYAMVISPQNETHGSVTVNILHGTPQEHRNMPLEDALKLVSRNFHEWVRGQRERVERERVERGPYTGVVCADSQMQLLLRMLADGRWVSPSEIDVVLRYLTERRDKMRGDERVRPPIVAPPSAAVPDPLYGKTALPQAAVPALKEDPDVAQKEQDLQNRIINLMNQGAPPSIGGGAPVDPPLRGAALPPRSEPDIVAPAEPAAAKTETAATYINFDNPSVKKALDNLMQSGPSLLKSISLGTAATKPTDGGFMGGANPRPDGMGIGGANPRPGLGGDALGGGANPRPGMGGDAMGVGANPRPGMGARGVPDMPSRGNVDMMSSRSGGGIPGMGDMMGARSNNNNMPMGRGYSNNDQGMGMSRMGQQQRGQDMGPPSMGMNRGFPPNQNQFNKFQGPPGQQQQQQGNFPPYGASNMGGGMPPRPNFGGMGAGMPRRF